jgi:uncharacterized protein (TIGR02300 family)
VAKAEWGLKRTCQSCGAKFYDMNRSPIVCPKCGAAFDPEALLKARRTKLVAAAKPAAEDESDIDDAEIGVEDKGEDEEAVMEDTSELGEDSEDVDEVVDGSDEPREDR